MKSLRLKDIPLVTKAIFETTESREAVINIKIPQQLVKQKGKKVAPPNGNSIIFIGASSWHQGAKLVFVKHFTV